MKKTIPILIMFSIILSFGCKQKDTTISNNPFLQEWNTPYGVPPFDKIKVEHYIPAFEEGIKQQVAEIDAICSNEEDATFENTVEALEYSGGLLYKVIMVFENLNECMHTPEMEEISEKISPILSQHGDDISLNKTLFSRIKSVYENRDELTLTPVQMRLLEETYKDFVRGGANIPEEQQARFREINEKLSLLTLKFGNNVLKASNGYKLVVDDLARLEGMPENALSAALDLGNKEEATKGKYVFTIQLPSWEPLLKYCKDRELREEMWKAYSGRCNSGEFDNREIINEIVNLRLERANMFGFPTHADYTLDNCMAKTPQAVHDLLIQMWKPSLNKAKQEAAEYQKMIDREGENFDLQPYDWRFYAEKLRKEKYDLNETEISAYFSLENVKNGAFMVSEKLIGITFVPNKNLPIYYPEVEAFDVKQGDKVIAILYMDYYPRESKRSGAWMTNFREQWYTKEGENIIPIVSLVLNSAKPTADAPALLTFDQTETFFHEFGHGLHGMLANCQYRSLSGTNVARDFVELPSQIMENWASEPEVMKMYAKHYKTGEIIPDHLIEKIQAAATYGQGFSNTELLAASFLDMDYYTITKPAKIEFPQFEDAAMSKIGLIPQIISRYKTPYFQHIFSGGYSSGYYSYTWAAVLDADAFEAFKETDIFDPATAKSFRENILEKGNTEDPMKLYTDFRGREPSIKALLVRRGLN